MKITENLKNKFKNTKKGIVYLFLIEANNLAVREQYQDFPDFGTKTPEGYINAKIDEIFKNGTGPFFRDDYKGFDEILQSALSARDSILKGDYNPIVVSFINTAVKSHIPVAAIRPKTVEIKPEVHLEIAKEQDRPQRTIKEKPARIVKEKVVESTAGLGMLLGEEEDEVGEEEELEEGSSEGMGGLL